MLFVNLALCYWKVPATLTHKHVNRGLVFIRVLNNHRLCGCSWAPFLFACRTVLVVPHAGVDNPAILCTELENRTQRSDCDPQAKCFRSALARICVTEFCDRGFQFPSHYIYTLYSQHLPMSPSPPKHSACPARPISSTTALSEWVCAPKTKWRRKVWKVSSPLYRKLPIWRG